MNIFKNYYARIWALKAIEAYGYKWQVFAIDNDWARTHLLTSLRRHTDNPYADIYLRIDMNVNLRYFRPTAMDCIAALFRIKTWTF